MSRSSAVLGVLALAVSASASHFRRTNHNNIHTALKRETVSGTAYWGFQNNTENACGTISQDSDFIIGVGPDYYGDMSTASEKCFQHITVALESDPSKTIDVTLTDACQDCGEPGNIYLSTSAFKALSGGDLDVGIINVTWEFGSSSSSSSSGDSSSDDSGDDSSSDSDSGDSNDDEGDDSSNDGDSGDDSGSTTATTTKKTSSTSTAKSSTKTGTSSDGWKLTSKLEGQKFLDFFNYDSGTGDNGGVADYVNGENNGLAYTSNGQVIIAVDDTQNVDTRKAVRMVSKTTFNAKDQNLFIFDIEKMPAVCGTWPAVWFTGANWPYDGEIDVVEGVSLYNQNIYSVHTGSGCSVSNSAVSAMSNVNIVQTGGTNCDANEDQAACGFSDNDKTTFGPGFNKAGGGVYALQFSTAGIKTWFFQAGKVPSDITSFAPEPSTWNSALRMSIPTSSCSPTTHFSDLMLIVNTNLGGSFTEGVWNTDGAGGQSKSCASQTGVGTAADYVRGHGSEFGEDAQWAINGIYIYNQ